MYFSSSHDDDDDTQVMRQVRVLVSGKGIYYKHWDEGVSCFKNRSITLATDFVKLWEEAKDFENKHGRDRGNGWLLLHPITKLLCFQIYKVGQIGVCDSVDGSSNGGSKDEDSSSEEVNSEEEIQKQWLRYVTTDDNETLRTISKMEDAPSLKDLLKNNRAQFPEIKADSRLKIGTSVWIRQALDENEERALKRRRLDEEEKQEGESCGGRKPTTSKSPYIGRSVKKIFEGYGTFKGKVESYNKRRRVYMVKYEDGDSEEMSIKHLKSILCINN